MIDFNEEEHSANALMKPCDFCGEVSNLHEGVCEQCLAIREENRKQIEDIGRC